MSVEPEILLAPQEEELTEEQISVAKDAELKNFRDHGVYSQTSMDEVPDTAKVIDTRWVIVPKAGGAKARLAVKDFRGSGPQDPDLYAPTPRISSLRALLARTSLKNENIKASSDGNPWSRR